MKYHDVIYKHYVKSEYPNQFAKYIVAEIFGLRARIVNTFDRYRVLDLGAGDGTYVNLFNKLGLDAHGIDRTYGPPSIDVGGWDLDSHRLPWEAESFDFIFTKSTIEHLYNTGHFLSEAYRLLKPNGKIVVLTPSWEHNMKWFYDDPTHVKPFHRKGLQDALRMAKFKEVQVNYFYHLPMTWNKKYGKLLAKLVAKIVPDSFRWKDKEEMHHNVFVRFCKEAQLLAVGTKHNDNGIKAKNLREIST